MSLSPDRLALFRLGVIDNVLHSWGMIAAHYTGQVPLLFFSVLHFVSKYSISNYISKDKKDTQRQDWK